MSQKRRFTPRPTYSLFKSLHEDVTRLLSAENLDFSFYNHDNDTGAIRTYDTNIMGRFDCANEKCPSEGWSSGYVPITIRMYDGKRYNARVYFQRCRICKRLSKPALDDSYAERVAYRLKKWSGVRQTPPEFSGDGESRGPHEESLCEGCKVGHCPWSRRNDDLVLGLSNLSLGIA